jgi:hypothetical protein
LIKNYPKDKFMIADDVQAYPIELWNWGICNYSGTLRVKPLDAVRSKLLPQGRATVTGKGIRFKGLYYECDLAWQENWFAQARIEGSWSVPISYDPRTVDRIYLSLDEGRKIEPCKLTPACQVWSGNDWQDIEDRRVLEKCLEKERETQGRQKKSEIHAMQNKIVEDAINSAKEAQRGISNSARIQEIRGNRALEKKRERDKDQRLFDSDSLPMQPSTTFTKEETAEDLFMSQQINWLRQKRDRGSNNA